MRLSLKARLTLTFIMLLGLMAAMGGFSLYQLQAMQTRSQTIVQENFSAIRTFDELAERSQAAALRETISNFTIVEKTANVPATEEAPEPALIEPA